jgi:Membrane protein involved in the export of O-antigen and teichoic acid
MMPMLDETIDGSKMEDFGVDTAKKSSIFVSGKLAALIFGAVLLIFLTRYLSLDGYGLYSVVYSYATVLTLGGNFGIGTTFRKRLADARSYDERSKLLANGYFLAIVLGLVLTLAGIAVSPAIAEFAYRNSALALPLEFAAATIFFSILYNVTVSALVGIGRVKVSGVVTVAYSLIQLVMVVYLVLAGYGVLGAIAGILGSLAVSSAIALAYLASSTRIRLIRPERKYMSGIMKFAYPVLVSNFATMGLMSFAIDFLGVFVSSAVVGDYGAAFRVGRYVEVILVSTTFVLMPAFSKLFSDESLSKKISSMYSNSMYYMLLFLVPVLAYGATVSVPLFRLFFSKAYSLGAIYFIIIEIGLAVSIIGNFAGALIVGYGDTKKFMKYQLTTIAIEMALLLVLTPLMQIYGVLISLFVVGPVVLDIVYMKALKRQFSIKIAWAKLLRVVLPGIILGLVMAGLAILLRERLLLIAINFAVAVLLYPPLVVLFGGINKKNIEILTKIGNKLGPAKVVLRYMLPYTMLFMKREGAPDHHD